MSAGEDPLVDDQSDHDINSVAGVLKLYFRGLENPLFPKERFLDLISTTSESHSRKPSREVQSLYLVLLSLHFFVKMSLFLFVSELDSGAERAHHLQQIIVTLQRPVIIVMRYLFAFLNQWVPSQLTPLFGLLRDVALIAFVPPVFLSTVTRTWWTPTT